MPAHIYESARGRLGNFDRFRSTWRYRGTAGTDELTARGEVLAKAPSTVGTYALQDARCVKRYRAGVYDFDLEYANTQRGLVDEVFVRNLPVGEWTFRGSTVGARERVLLAKETRVYTSAGRDATKDDIFGGAIGVMGTPFAPPEGVEAYGNAHDFQIIGRFPRTQITLSWTDRIAEFSPSLNDGPFPSCSLPFCDHSWGRDEVLFLGAEYDYSRSIVPTGAGDIGTVDVTLFFKSGKKKVQTVGPATQVEVGPHDHVWPFVGLTAPPFTGAGVVLAAQWAVVSRLYDRKNHNDLLDFNV